MTACQMEKREFDETVWEMVLAVKECKLSNPEAMKSLVDEWVSMQENEQCNNLLAGEIDELMDLEVLCKLEEVSTKDEEDDNEEVLEDSPREPATFDELNELAIELKTLQIQIDALEGEYHAVGDAYDACLSIRKTQTKQ